MCRRPSHPGKDGLGRQVAKLKVLRGDFQNQKYRLEDKLLKTFPEEIQKQKTRIAALQQDSQIAAAHPQDKENFCGMTIKGMVYDDKRLQANGFCWLGRRCPMLI